MAAIVVNMLDDGAFEVVGSQGEGVRVLNNDEGSNKSWVIMKRDWTGVRWEVLWDFTSLDSALNAAVYEATGEEKPDYEVRLPDGMKFKRPGLKTAEEVMASAGWYFMAELIGFIPLTTSTDRSAFDVRAEYAKMIKGDDVRLGDVNISDEDDEGRHWIADVVLDYRGWLHLDEVNAAAAEEFRKEGLNVIPFFDHRTRTNVACSEAVILQFPMDRVVRAA